MRSKRVVLFMASDPFETDRLHLGREARELAAALRGSPSALHLKCAHALRVDDLQSELLESRACVAHFSGHGHGREGIYLEDANGEPHLVSREALAGLFTTLRTSVRVVVFNACSSSETLEPLRDVVDYLIGMTRPIGDVAATRFSAAFYRALAHAETVTSAFSLAVNQLLLFGSAEADVPTLIVRAGVDASRPLFPARAKRSPSRSLLDLRDATVQNVTAIGRDGYVTYVQSLDQRDPLSEGSTTRRGKEGR